MPRGRSVDDSQQGDLVARRLQHSQDRPGRRGLRADRRTTCRRSARTASSRRRNSVSNARGCSLVRTRMAKSRGSHSREARCRAMSATTAFGFFDFIRILFDSRALAAGSSGAQDFWMPLLVEGDQPIGQFENLRRAAIVVFQPDDRRLGPVVLESQDVFDLRPRANRKSTDRRRRRRTDCDATRRVPSRCDTACRSCPGIRRSADDRNDRLLPAEPRHGTWKSSSVSSSRSSKSTAPLALSCF